MSGDFLSFLIHQNPDYYSIPDNFNANDPRTTEHNMWRFPNLLEPIGLEAKIYPSDWQWRVSADDLATLDSIYGDKNILLPSHWYNNINQYTTQGLFDRGIRLFVKERKILKICYAMWWVKSHAIAHMIWPHRQEEIEEMLNKNHPNKNLLPEILESYHNWKFIAVKYSLLKDGKLDIGTYIRRHFNELYSLKNHTKHTTNYLALDLDNLIYGDFSNVTVLEDYLNVSIDKDTVRAYTDTNYQMLENYLGIRIFSDEFDNDETYFNAILNYAKDIINAKPDQFDYYNGKR